jgi:hypothetical protein
MCLIFVSLLRTLSVLKGNQAGVSLQTCQTVGVQMHERRLGSCCESSLLYIKHFYVY